MGQPGWRPTFPPNGAIRVLFLTPGQQISDVDFGVTTLNISAGDRGPAFVSAPVISGQIGAPYFYQPQVRNLDGSPLTFDVLVAPAGLAMNAQTGGIAWLPTTDQSGNNRVLIRVKDDRGLVDIQDFTIAVAAAPTAPVFTSIPLTTAALNVVYHYQPRVQDAEGGAFVFALPTAPAGMTINPQSGLITWTPASGQENASYLVTITETDSTNLTARQDFQVIVAATATNHAPHITSTPRKTAGLDRPYRYQLTATDADGDLVTFTPLHSPAGLTIDAVGIVKWTPAALGNFNITIQATDGRGGADTQSYTVSVTSQLPNITPQFTSSPPTATVAGGLFAYDSHATDADGDALQYVLDKAPAGMSLDASTGALRWQTPESLRGDFNVTLRAIDPYGAEATQSFTLAVRFANEPPAITSIPPTEAAINVAYTYAVAAVDPFGRPLVFTLLDAPDGMILNAETGTIAWTPTNLQLGLQSVVIQATNDPGGAATQAYDIVVTDGTPNLPPVITSSPSEQATVNVEYQYAIQATDPEGLNLHYMLRSGPLGMTIDIQTGVVRWTPTALQVNTQQVTVVALDPAGATAIQTFLITALAANHAPTINSTALAKNLSAGALFRYTVATTDQDNDVLTYTLTQSPAGMTIDDFGRITWQTQNADIGQRPVSVIVSDGRGGTNSQSFTINVVADTTPPRVTVIPATSLVYAFNSVTIRVSATDDVGIASLSLTMDGNPIPLDDHGVAVVPFPATGRISTFTATAVDFSGNTAHGSTNVKFFNGEEVSNAPQVAIISPADTGVVFGPTDVIGTVSDDNIREWRLFVRPEDAPDSAFVEIGSGATTVNNATLGRFDPTLLENGSYLLRLDATDNTGNETFTDNRIGVSGEFKLGNFQLAFTDLTIPVSGIPITVVRTYDTLRANREGDFGFGWRLDFRNTDLRTGLPKTGLEEFGVFSAFRPGTKVYLTLPGGRREGFTFNPEIRSFFDLTTVTPRFTPDPGVTDTLSVKGGTFLLADDGAVYSGEGQPFNPAAEEFGGGYTLTNKEGVVFQIDGNSGKLNSATDRNKNALSFTDAGITGSGGAQISFQRDAHGRIVSITDPNGKSIKYVYSSTGDLATVTDRDGHRVQHSYDATHPHYLSQIIDPLGRTAVRSLFDEDGRLIGVTDALGKMIAIHDDVSAMQEVVTDPLGHVKVTGYDERGNVTHVTDALQESTTYTYDANNNRLSIANPLGETTQFAYDADGNPTSIINPLGATTRSTFNQFGQVLSLTNPLGATALNTYDSRGNLLTQVDALGNMTSLSHDSAGNPTSFTDARGNSAQNQFDFVGNRTHLTNLAGNEIAIQHDSNGNILSQADSTSLAWNFAYGAGDQLTQVMLGTATQTLGYDAIGQVSSATDANGAVTRFTTDALNRLTQIVAPDGVTVVNRAYDAAGNVLTDTDSVGNVTSYQYDDVNRLTATVYPDGSIERRAYDAAGRLIQLTDALGRITHYEYDAAGQQISQTDALGGVTSQQLDAAGNLVAVTDPLGHATRFAFDDGGRLIKTILADSSSETQFYDELGNLVCKVDSNDNATTYTYDSAGLLTAVTDALGNTTRYEYDQAGRRKAIVDANGNTTHFTYDSQGRLTLTTQPLGQASSITYDRKGQITSTTNGNAETIQYAYDNRGRLVKKTLPGESPEARAYTPDGLLSSVTDARGTTQIQYDPVTRRLIRVTQSDGRYIRYAYDAVGNRTLVADAVTSGAVENVTRYAFDNLNRLIKVTDLSGGVTNYSYDADGNVLSILRPNGITTTNTYSVLNDLTTIVDRNSTTALVASFTYTFDAAGNRLTQTDADGARVAYSYDADGRVTSESHFAANGTPAGTTTYAYDATGNQVSRTGALGNATFTYNANGQLIVGDGITYAYDGAGNLTSATDGNGASTHYTFDSRGRLVKVQPPTGGATTYAYDFLGIRQSATSPAGVVNYLVDSNNPTGVAQVIRETNATGTTLRSYVYGTAILSETQGGATSFYLSDALGSTRLLTNSAGVITDTSSYSAYGTLLNHTGTTPNSYLFAGQHADANTGLYYLRARYYNPATGNFLSRDSAEGDQFLPLSLVKYLYANANPVNFLDPTGFEAETLTELQAEQLIENETKIEELKNVKRLKDKAGSFAGKVTTYFGAAIAVLAEFNAVSNPLLAENFFGHNPVTALEGLVNLARVAFKMFSDGGTASFEIDAPKIANEIEFWASVNEPSDALFPELTIVHLYPPFFFIPPITIPGQSLIVKPSMIGVMVHEWAHLALNIRDLKGGYGEVGAQGFFGGQALANADNYRVYVEAFAAGDGAKKLAHLL